MDLTKEAKEVIIHKLNETLCAFAREGHLDALYEALKGHPNFLDKIDKIPFVHTPLHEAAGAQPPQDEARRTEFALELLNLKPSFGRKLNPDGKSPLHLALHNRFSALAKRLIEYDSELIRVKGRERKTPLHCLAEIGDIETELLAEFLFACPESIKDLTIRKETALHIAVKHGQVEAFKLIFEWIWRSYYGELLIWKDQDGNTVLHIAALNNQLTIVDLLVKSAPIIKNEKNCLGLTAHAIAREERIKAIILGRAKIPPIPKIHGEHEKEISLDQFLLSKEPCAERFLRFILYCRRELSLDMRNMVLVVAVLIATATYQDLGNLTDTAGLSSQKGGRHYGIRNYSDMTFYFLNTISFTASVAVMILVLNSRPFTYLLHLSLVFLTISYGYKLLHTSGIQYSAAPILLIILLVYVFKMIFFLSMERDINMRMPAFWIKDHPRWRALIPGDIPLARLRMVYQLMRG